MSETATERWSSRLNCPGPSGYWGRSSALVVILSLVSWVSVFAQSHKPTEYDVKAAYLYNFGKFIKWPPGAISSERTFPICILGSDPFGSSLNGIASGESLDNKRLAIVRIESVSAAQNCRIVFIGRSEEGRLGSITSTVSKWPVLTVSDIPEFLEHGGMIEFVMQGDRVRFRVNLPAAERTGLSLSSELLKVAVAVKRNSPAGE